MKEDQSTLLGRREFLGTLTVAAAGALPATAQAAGEKASETPVALKIVDFHNHYVGPNFPLTTPRPLPRCKRTGKASIAIWPIQAP
jgi:hypothetical protein